MIDKVLGYFASEDTKYYAYGAAVVVFAFSWIFLGWFGAGLIIGGAAGVLATKNSKP